MSPDQGTEILKRLDLILELFQRQDGRIGNLETGQQRLEAGQQRLEAGQQHLAGRVERLEVGQQQLTAKVERLEEGQQSVLRQLARIDGTLEAQAKRLDDQSRILAALIPTKIAAVGPR
ncbi:hypothetical protein HHL28_09845 [Aerophototrophica crusticola]|uniref:Uncharacterized protein n=1 Tax=Aerophototrophica crusticola TaxID=1709002 RepID=A0A858R7J5_9PROT|nr:hypothetical protein HHL28_09845 [Rhodospirillaceae bacterium B3]